MYNVPLTVRRSNWYYLKKTDDDEQNYGRKKTKEERSMEAIKKTGKVRLVRSRQKKYLRDLRSTPYEWEERKGLSFLSLINKTEGHFFPELRSLMAQIKDDRASNSKYTVLEILISVIYHFSLRSGTLNDLDEARKNKDFRTNFEKIFKTKLPSADTIRKALVSIPSEFTEEILQYMITELKNKKYLKKFELILGLLVISVDAVTYNSSKKYDELSVTKEKNGKKTHYRTGLECKICLSNGVTIPIFTEWLDTKDGATKEDCENAAFKRAAIKLKSIFGEDNILIVGDGLYANEPVIQVCEDNGWEYILSIKNGQNKKTWQQVLSKFGLDENTNNYEISEELYLKKMSQEKKESDSSVDLDEHVVVNKKEVEYEGKTEIITKVYGHLTDLKHKEKNINFICVTDFNGTPTEYRSKVFFSFITSKNVNKNMTETLVSTGRLGRSMIENSFNTAKNRGYLAKHKFSRISGNATKNFNNLRHIGELINNLVTQCDVVRGALLNHSRATITRLWKEARERMSGLISMFKLEEIKRSLPKNFSYKIINWAYIC